MEERHPDAGSRQARVMMAHLFVTHGAERRRPLRLFDREVVRACLDDRVVLLQGCRHRDGEII